MDNHKEECSPSDTIRDVMKDNEVATISEIGCDWLETQFEIKMLYLQQSTQEYNNDQVHCKLDNVNRNSKQLEENRKRICKMLQHVNEMILSFKNTNRGMEETCRILIAIIKQLKSTCTSMLSGLERWKRDYLERRQKLECDSVNTKAKVEYEKSEYETKLEQWESILLDKEKEVRKYLDASNDYDRIKLNLENKRAILLEENEKLRVINENILKDIRDLEHELDRKEKEFEIEKMELLNRRDQNILEEEKMNERTIELKSNFENLERGKEQLQSDLSKLENVKAELLKNTLDLKSDVTHLKSSLENIKNARENENSNLEKVTEDIDELLKIKNRLEQEISDKKHFISETDAELKNQTDVALSMEEKNKEHLQQKNCEIRDLKAEIKKQGVVHKKEKQKLKVELEKIKRRVSSARQKTTELNERWTQTTKDKLDSEMKLKDEKDILQKKYEDLMKDVNERNNDKLNLEVEERDTYDKSLAEMWKKKELQYKNDKKNLERELHGVNLKMGVKDKNLKETNSDLKIFAVPQTYSPYLSWSDDDSVLQFDKFRSDEKKQIKGKHEENSSKE